MIAVTKFIFFIMTLFAFGSTSLLFLANIRSAILLLALSLPIGIASYVFLLHSLSFIIGPRAASIISILIIFLILTTILTIKRKYLKKKISEIEFSGNIYCFVFSALLIIILSYFAVNRSGVTDIKFHNVVSLTIFQNNIYPPKDMFRPEYLLIYHYGSDLFAGAINYIFNININKSFELIVSIMCGVTFLCFCATGWILSKNYLFAYIAGFCGYFSGGLLWFDALLKYLSGYSKTLNLDFIQSLANFGIHGSILNAPSSSCLVPTFNFGYPLLTTSFILFWHMVNLKENKKIIIQMILLNLLLFGLFLSAEWLYFTFWIGILPFSLFYLANKSKKNFYLTLSLLITSTILSKLIGNAIFLQDKIQNLGRANIFNIDLKEKLFWITSWGKFPRNTLDYSEISLFSWDFVSDFGVTIILIPLIVFYLVKTKNMFAVLLSICSILTMSLPLFIDFKTNPADLNRFFSFGNAILAILILYSIEELIKNSRYKRILILAFVSMLTFSPFLGLLLSSTLTKYCYMNKDFSGKVRNEVSQLKTLHDYIDYFKKYNDSIFYLKNEGFIIFDKEIKFLKENMKAKDFAISADPRISLFSGIYTIVPSRYSVYKDQLYSSFDSIYSTIFNTLDPYLLKELGIKWIILESKFKEGLPKEVLTLLDNRKKFNLLYTNKVAGTEIEIYQVQNIEESLLASINRKTNWILVNKYGHPVVSTNNPKDIISFPSSKDALLYLSELHTKHKSLKKELFTSQAIVIDNSKLTVK